MWLRAICESRPHTWAWGVWPGWGRDFQSTPRLVGCPQRAPALGPIRHGMCLVAESTMGTTLRRYCLTSTRSWASCGAPSPFSSPADKTAFSHTCSASSRAAKLYLVGRTDTIRQRAEKAGGAGRGVSR